jgi:hypothetical protein
VRTFRAFAMYEMDKSIAATRAVPQEVKIRKSHASAIMYFVRSQFGGWRQAERATTSADSGVSDSPWLKGMQQKTIMQRILLVPTVQMVLSLVAFAQTVSLPEPSQVRPKDHVVSLALHAVNENGRDAFSFDGIAVAPVIRAAPGDVLKITASNTYILEPSVYAPADVRPRSPRTIRSRSIPGRRGGGRQRT